MKANELRLGNLYHFKDVSGMVVERVDYIENNMVDANPMDLIHPIPLTEKWLVRFGFHYDSSLSLYNINGYDVDCGNGYVHFYVCEYGEWYMKIQYVHQLQNLYFALTGTELTLKNEDK